MDQVAVEFQSGVYPANIIGFAMHNLQILKSSVCDLIVV